MKLIDLGVYEVKVVNHVNDRVDTLEIDLKELRKELKKKGIYKRELDNSNITVTICEKPD